MKKLFRLNLLPFVAKAVAIVKDVRPMIDDIYSQDKERFYEVAKVTDEFADRYFKENDIETEIYCRKAYGIMVATESFDDALAKDTDQRFIKVVRQAYKPVYTFIKAYKYIDFNVFNEAVITHTESIDEIYSCVAVLLYFVKIYGNKINMEDPVLQLRYVELYKIQQRYKNPPQAYFAEKIHEPERQQRIKMVTEHIRNRVGSLPHSLFKVNNNIKIYSDKKLYSDFTLLSNLLTYDIPVSAIDNIEFTDDDLNDIFDFCSSKLPKDTDDIPSSAYDDALHFFCLSILVRSYARAYMNAKEYYFSHASDLRDTEEVSLLRSNVSHGLQEISSLKELADDKQEKLNKLQLDFDRLNKKYMKLQESSSAKIKELNDEIAVFNEIIDAAGKEPETYTATADDVKDLKVLVLGGSVSWQNHISKLFPKFKIVPVNDCDFDKALIDSADYVVFNWLYGGHGLFYRLINRIRSNSKNIIYIGNNNERFFIQAIADASKS
jgi:hypothetical protein